MQLVFEKSGDSLSLDFFHNRLSDLWLTRLKEHHATSFSLRHRTLPVPQLAQQLTNLVEQVNQQLSRIGIPQLEFSADQVLTQTTLNSLHQQWVDLSTSYPKLHQLMNNFGLMFNDINEMIHEIEQRDHYAIEFENIGLAGKALGVSGQDYKDCMNYGTCHLAVEYHNLGRTTFNTWETDDDAEINNYDVIRFDIKLTLAKPRTNQPFPEYLDWCQRKGIEPFPDTIPLANFSGYKDKIADLRHIVYRNLSKDSNVQIVG